MAALKVLSLNTMGVPFAPKRKVRFDLICDFVKSFDPDIVALQEIGDRFLYSFLKNKLPQYFFYPNKIGGLINRDGALLLLTKVPLLSYRFLKYKIGEGPFLPFSLVEKLSRKGFQIGELEINSQKFFVVNTHLLASFFNHPKEYLFMENQLRELIKFISSNLHNRRLIVTGDFNFADTNKLYYLFLKETNCHDPLRGTGGFTHSKNNLNVSSLNRFLKKLTWGDKREDYTFTLGFTESSIIQKINTDIHYVKNEAYALSDHYAILTTLNI